MVVLGDSIDNMRDYAIIIIIIYWIRAAHMVVVYLTVIKIGKESKKLMGQALLIGEEEERDNPEAEDYGWRLLMLTDWTG